MIPRRSSSMADVRMKVSEDWTIISNGPKAVKVSKITKHGGKFNHSYLHRQDGSLWSSMIMTFVMDQEEDLNDQIKWIMNHIEMHEDHVMNDFQSRFDQVTLNSKASSSRGEWWLQKIEQIRHDREANPHPRVVMVDDTDDDIDRDWRMVPIWDCDDQ